MSKPLSEEVLEFNRLRNNLLFIICLFLFPLFSFSQSEREIEKFSLNGFGRFLVIRNNLNLFNLFSYDVDGDGNIDIGGLDESGKILYILYGKGFNKFSEPIRYTFENNLTGIIVRNLKINGKTNLITYSKLGGNINIYSFNRRIITRLITLKVDCCFSDLNIVNIDGAGPYELILSGMNFEGIGVISFKGDSYSYRKIEKNHFKKLIPFFLNSDNKIDLVGYDGTKRELVLLLQNSIYNYSKTVYKKFDESIDLLFSGNFDDDDINDLALLSTEAKKIYVLFGNGIGAFTFQRTIKLTDHLSDALVLDCNRDLIDDFLSFDKSRKTLVLNSFARNGVEINSIPLIQINRLNSFVVYRTINTKGVLISSDEGLYLIYHSTLISKNEKFSLASSISDLETFHLVNEFYPRIIFIDNDARRLNILIRNEFNSPQELMFIPLSSNYEKIKFQAETNNIINIVCFKPYSYHFDFYKIDLNNGKFKRELLAIDGYIKDINFSQSLNQKLLLNVLKENQDELGLVILNPFEVNKLILNEHLSRIDFEDYHFDFTNRELIILKKDPDKKILNLISKSFDGSYKKWESRKLFSIQNDNYTNMFITKCENIVDSDIIFLFLSNSSDDKLIVFSKKNPEKYFTLDKIRLKDKSSCKCKKHSSITATTFSFYNELSSSYEKLVLSPKNKALNLVIKNLPLKTNYSIDYSLKRNTEFIYVTDFSIINIELLSK